MFTPEQLQHLLQPTVKLSVLSGIIYVQLQNSTESQIVTKMTIKQAI